VPSAFGSAAFVGPSIATPGEPGTNHVAEMGRPVTATVELQLRLDAVARGPVLGTHGRLCFGWEGLRVRRRFCLIVLLLSLVGCAGPQSPISLPTPRATTTPATPVSSPVPVHTPTPGASPTATSTPPALDPLQVSLAWRYATQEMVWSMATADLDGDGAEEVIAASYDKHVYAFEDDGRLLWKHPTDGPVYCLETGDLDGDGEAEVVVGGDDNSVRALTGEGDPLWGARVGSRVTSVSIGDVDGDGKGEVLAGCWDGQLQLLDAGGELRWRSPGEEGVSATKMVDLDRDGRLDMLVGYQGGAVSLVAADGILQWTYRTGGHVRELTTSDLDMDTHAEIVVGSADGWLYAISEDGDLEWKASLGDPVITLDVADVDGDGKAEIAAGTGPHAPGVWLLDHLGEPRWTYDVGKSIWAVRLADADGDGDVEIIAGGDDGNIYILDIYGRLRDVYHTERRVHGLGLARATEGQSARLIARSGNDVYVLAVASTEHPPREPEPMEEPSTFPSWTKPVPGLAEGGEESVELVAVGDIMLSRTVEERMEVYGSTYPFEAVTELLQGADIAIGNLESPLSVSGEPLQKRFVFRANPRHAEALARAGFDVMNVANNHLLDFGQEGIEQTLQILRDVGVAYLGAGLSPEEARRPLVLWTKGRRIAFLSYAASRWKGSSEVPTSAIISFAEVAAIQDDVERARQRADLVVVVMHLGTEYQSDPDQEQLAVSRAAIDAGACLVIGHHPHVVQGTGTFGEGFVAYSLGDLVFDIDVTEAARDGAILRVLLGDRGVEAVDLVPVRIVDDVQPRFLVGEDALPVVRQVWRAPGG
jgi:poly-gamma-glutamate capsule biosynthesis protein CapA/YwtB (metallophosphatase superfamily)/outer membrane protein assembly factor BamB